MLRTLAAAALTLACASSLADEARIRGALEPRLGGARIEGIQPAPIAGLYEVRYRSAEGTEILYTDATGSYVILTDGREAGHILDLRQQVNLTAERMRKLNAIKFASLPLDLAVKIQRGNGKRVLAMFSDPYCPACRSFERQLAQVDDVTIYVFMYPVIRPENADHSRAVWCSADRAKSWLALAAGPRPRVPEAAPTCDDPVDRVLDLGRSLRINSTPTLILPSGERFSGGMAAGDLRQLLDQAPR